jgi:hypothetical protein
MPREGKISRLYPYYCGSVRLNHDTLPSTLPTHLAECLRRAGAWEVNVDENCITFKGSTVGTIWDVLVPFGCGDLEVDSANREIRYRLRTAHLVVWATVTTVLAGAFLLAIGFFPRVLLVVILPFVWVWFPASSILVKVPRFDTFLHRSISSAPKTPASTPEAD